MQSSRYIILLLTLAFLSACSGPKDAAGKKKVAAKELSFQEEAKLMSLFIDANTEKMHGNLEYASTLFVACLKIDPLHSASMYELSKLKANKGEYEDARTLIEQAVTLEPENEWYQLGLAQLYEREARYAQSTEIYKSLTNEHPQKVEYQYMLAAALSYQGKRKEAIEVYNQIEVKTGISEDISLEKQRLYEESGDLENAYKELQALIDYQPDNPRYYVLLGDLYQKHGEKEKALAAYETLLKIDPNNPHVQLSLYNYYRDAGEEDKAYATLEKAFKNPDLSIDTKVQILLTYYAATETREELKDFAFSLNKALVETHPNEAKAHSIYADFLYREKRFKEARTHYRKAVELDGSKYILWSQLLILDSELNDFDAMLEESNKAIELFPSQPSFYFFNGVAHNQKENYSSAVDILEEGVILVFDNTFLLTQFYSTLGDAYNSLEDFKKSDDSFEKALEADPDNTYVLNNYSYFLSLRNEKLDLAEKMAGKCVELEPGSASYLDTYAWVLYRLEKYEDAKTWIEVALTKGGDKSGVVLEHYGDILFKLGQPEKAMQYWEQAKEKGDFSDLLPKKIETGELYE